MKLDWEKTQETRTWLEATLGDFAGGDGVRFSLTHHPTCYRRGPWKLLVEVAPGAGHLLWGCFDESDQPVRWYHCRENALSEAQAIADVLAKDRSGRAPALERYMPNPERTDR